MTDHVIKSIRLCHSQIAHGPPLAA